ncbi:D-alanyl-D-alanine carboxypeptidase/D-alanyl-D-alanine-endopeptidase [Actinoplanes sp. M2I2]|uniref:D-alanyl-D-alanine carboxypeptidase/D-alanyl-D-alanine endopeptidase n=1 Tax=Actinoplanes sp. M2I2 TaxID=1734444 RepID=UPI002020D880|nr:D-alanyl-D-alanine carboxypeptidase/D-alanyl-D-alanine-endopeptidase [Actinoplanes sp. M2I2]
MQPQTSGPDSDNSGGQRTRDLSAPPGGSASPADATGGSYGRASVPLNNVPQTNVPQTNVPQTNVPQKPVARNPVPSNNVRPLSPASGPAPSVPAGGSPGQVAGGPAGPDDGGGPAAATGSSSRTRWIWALSVVVALVLAAGVVGLVRPGPVDRWLSAAPASTPTPAPAPTTPDPSPTPVLAAAAGGGSAPSAQGVTRAIDPLVKSAALGTKVHVAVLDVASGDVLYARNADTMTTPASTTKLLTAAAVLDARGPSYRLSTRVVAGAAPGEVVLIGGGDPTLSTTRNRLFPGAARLDLLAAQVKKSLGATRPALLRYDTSLFSGPETAKGWDSTDITYGQVSRIQALMVNAGRIRPIHNEFGGDPRSSDPADAAAKAFAKMLGLPSSAVRKGKAPAAAPAPPSGAAAGLAPGQQLGVVQSPPMVQLTDWMLEQSDNTAAEALSRQVAIADGKPGTFDDATEAIVARMRGLGLPSDEADLYDASGLSRNNGISPTMLTQLLALAASGRQPALSSLFGGLPVAGWSGTMVKRFVSPAPHQRGQGVVRAKTGTLSGVNTMAGTLTTADGRLLVFAIMASGSGSALTGRAALDAVATKLVSCGC